MTRTLVIAVLLATSIASFAQDAPRRDAGVTPHASLGPLAWLAGGRWVATPDDPKAANLMRETFFKWSPNGQALRFWSFTANRKFVRQPYVEGWYLFHPGRRQIVFTYVDPGGYYTGEVRSQGDTLEHDFEGVSSKGAVQKFRYTFTRTGADEMSVTIYVQAESGWREVIALVYRRQPF